VYSGLLPQLPRSSSAAPSSGCNVRRKCRADSNRDTSERADGGLETIGRRVTRGSIGRWTLRVVVLALALVGFLHVTRGTAVRLVRGVSTDGAAISVGEPEFLVMAAMATGGWLGAGNRVEVMQNGDGTFPRLWEDLRLAQRSITLQLVLRCSRSDGRHARWDSA
jgi:hypothetical protein